jgi:hypothetical protein
VTAVTVWTNNCDRRHGFDGSLNAPLGPRLFARGCPKLEAMLLHDIGTDDPHRWERLGS